MQSSACLPRSKSPALLPRHPFVSIPLCVYTRFVCLHQLLRLLLSSSHVLSPFFPGGANSNGDRHVLVIDRDNETLYEVVSYYHNT